jgi:hypothetical protein
MTTDRLHQLPAVAVDKYIIIFQSNHILQDLHPEFLLHFWKQQENSVMMLPSTQETMLIKKVNSIILVQSAISDRHVHGNDFVW